MHLISCRNVLIYFNTALQNRVVNLFASSLTRGGFLGLGANESLRFIEHGQAFGAFDDEQRIYRRLATRAEKGEAGRVVA